MRDRDSIESIEANARFFESLIDDAADGFDVLTLRGEETDLG